ncbi:AAA family ATPase [Burkholderia sp. MSMB0856]|uniref:AlbA family DNA-binding domain-containing protein n=1 Tax=Burkholderia sp. MSMB0856 TaxID=1637869 RepID=UPI00075996CF|nr:ATP-binding protein [Burkholderia sp. MSMB0856]AOJ87165.1 AAA family ATPase [Burkholderia sp. MSMB0856]KVH38870.1 AAA family ATPase [Burkholderia sp. MSMB0856]
MLGKADLRDVTFADLLALKENQIPESHTLDFKRDFPTEKDARVSLAADVVAFANTRGGDLILGADEEGGVISRFVPIELQNVDAALRSLQSTLTDLIEPKIPGVHLEAIAVPDGGYIVIVRTPSSFQAPHRVRKSGAFYTRTSTGIDPMDITTLRSAFLQSATATERVRAFREDRVIGLRQRPLSAPLRKGAVSVLHIVPIASILGALNFDINSLHGVAQLLRPPVVAGGWGARINLDGAMSISAVEETFSYTQLFRNGSIETVMPVQSNHSSVAWVGALEDALVTEHHHQALVEAHTKLGVEGPAFVMLSFVDIGGAQLEQSNSVAAAIYGDAAVVPAYYANLALPELFVESFVTSAANIYGPLFDMVWNAAGRPARPQRR